MSIRYWVAVASKNHVDRGVCEGFVQVCHGKGGPLKRVHQGDWVIYYSPKLEFDKPEKYQKFTAIGRVTADELYQHDMGGGFIPFRKDVEYIKASDALIMPLIGSLSFIKNKKNWGIIFRSGFIEIPHEDFLIIAQAMKADLPNES